LTSFENYLNFPVKFIRNVPFTSAADTLGRDGWAAAMLENSIKHEKVKTRQISCLRICPLFDKQFICYILPNSSQNLNN